MPSEFKNEPFTDFSDPANEEAMTQALQKVSGELGRDYDLIIGGEKVSTDDKIRSIDPSNPNTLIGSVSKATRDHAEQALRAADEAFATWKHVKPAERAEYLFKAAAKGGEVRLPPPVCCTLSHAARSQSVAMFTAANDAAVCHGCAVFDPRCR